MGILSKVLEKSGKDVAGTNSLDRSVVSGQQGAGPSPSGESGMPQGRGARSTSTTAGWDPRLLKAVNFSQETSEAFRQLRSKILLSQDGEARPRTIMVTSCLPKEGKSFVCANLGIAIAQGMDEHALLVDCDLRLPRLATMFGVNSEVGLVDYLRDGVPLHHLMVRTSVDKLAILPSGNPPVNPAELLGSAKMQNLVQELSSRYPDRFVIFDSPPFQAASESLVLSQAVDGVVLVVGHGQSSRVLLEKVIEDIGRDRILGVLLNGHKRNALSSRLLKHNEDRYGEYRRPK